MINKYLPKIYNLVLILFTILLGLSVLTYSQTIPQFNNIKINISGNRFINDLQILEQINPLINQSLIKTNLNNINKSISLLEFIETSQTSIILPNILVIQIIEKEPIFLFNNNGNNTFIDKKGNLIKPQKNSINYFPVPIITVNEKNFDNNIVYKNLFSTSSFIYHNYNDFYVSLSELIVEEHKWVFLSDKNTKVYTNSNNLLSQLKILKQFEKTVYPIRTLGDYSYIDLRVKNQVIVKEKIRNG